LRITVYIVDCKAHNPRSINLICNAILDAKRGSYKAFKDIPIQNKRITYEVMFPKMYHFHQKKIVQKHIIMMKAKLGVEKNLKKIIERLTQTTEKNFT
jgi:hypothetical protein